MAASGVFAATPSKRAFSSISFEHGLEDRENCSPMRINSQAGWVPPAKRTRNFADLANATSGRAASTAGSGEASAFPSVGVPHGFVGDQVKAFLKQQKRAERAAAAGGVLAAAAAQFRSSPGPVRFNARNGASGPGADHEDSRAVDAMQQSSPLHDCGAAGEDYEDESGAQSMDGAGCGPEGKAAAPKQQLFTRTDVERIVHNALQQQESELRRHYDDVLQTQLHDQFSNLSRFNQDHIARSMQSSTHDYFC